MCDISQENIEAAPKELAGRPWSAKIHFQRCDVSARSEVEQWILNIHKETGHIDVLINNAAFVRWESVTKCLSKIWNA